MFEELTDGAWVITNTGCPVRVASNKDDQFATLILGTHPRELEIAVEPQTLAAILREGATALRTLSGQDNADEPQVEAVVVRDPDGPTEVSIFIDGSAVEATQFTVDAGAGWTRAEWTRAREDNLTLASPAARATLARAYANVPGGRYIDRA
ncbi:hypothetical protein [Nocardia sp. CC227C]|uniref:hypothetical protein n=1 Tax=Nocardia sp. CC227C TaxID=3044562 RepID=UPI00278C30E5|nr:hypothetical protein [Nocardia sp. CC227C]